MKTHNPYADESEDDEDALAKQRTRDQRDDDLRFIMGNEQGRRFLWNLLAEAGVYRSSYIAGDPGTDFREGSRAVGLKLLSDIDRVCPHDYLRMVQEKLPKNEV